MDRWLTAEDKQRFRGALHVSLGRELILKTIEERMLERAAEEIRRAEQEQWSRTARESELLPAADEPLLRRLWTEYTTTQRGTTESGKPQHP